MKIKFWTITKLKDGWFDLTGHFEIGGNYSFASRSIRSILKEIDKMEQDE